MRTKISKRYSSYKSQPKVFKLFLDFLLSGPQKDKFGFEILKSDQQFFAGCGTDDLVWNVSACGGLKTAYTFL